MLSFLLWVAEENTDHDIPLDPRIRDWVLLPIFAVMFMQGVLRQYVSVLLADRPKVNLQLLANNELVKRSQRYRVNGHYIPESAFRMRRAYFTQKAFARKVKEGEKEEAPPQDPMAMMGMMKQNMAMIVPNMVLMGWVSYFFAGFVLAKLPFPLTERFKAMLQRGIFLKSLNASYVSSLSFYFITMFGMRGLFSLVLGSAAADIDTRAMQAQMQMGAGQGMQPVDHQKIFEVEKNEIEILQHDFVIRDAEYKLLGREPPMVKLE
jgi:hypothetical protein